MEIMYPIPMGSSFRSKLKWVLNWGPAALSVAMIAAESTATMSSDNTSHWLLPIWVHLFGPISAVHWAKVHFLIRKTGHFVGYGLVGAAFFHGWKSSLSKDLNPRLLWRQASILGVFSAFLVACADEYHQSFLPSRTSSPIDVGIDVCGAIAAQILILAMVNLYSRRSVTQRA